jgi:hypothetical protein
VEGHDLLFPVQLMSEEARAFVALPEAVVVVVWDQARTVGEVGGLGGMDAFL